MIKGQAIPLVRQVIYTAYASFPTAGLQVADLAFATDRICLYRWSGSAWQSIGISSRHGAKAAIGTAADYPESSLYQADDENLLYMVVSAAWQQVTFTKELPTWAAGDYVVISANTEQSTQSTAPVKKKELAIASGGTIRVSFDLRSNDAGKYAYGRVYKNGAAFGTLRSTQSLTYVSFSQDLAFAVNDLVQLYIYQENVVFWAYCRNFQLKADRYHLHTVLTD